MSIFQSKLKIIHKITLAYFFTIILPIFIITTIIYYQFFEREKNNVIELQKSIMRLSKETLNNDQAIIKNIGESISKEPRLRQFLSGGAFSTSYSVKEYQYSISPIFEYSRLIQNINAHSTRVFMHDTTLPESGKVFIHDTALLELDWYKDLIKSPKKSLWLGPQNINRLQGHKIDNEDHLKKVYSFCQKIYSTKGKYIGLLVINIYQENLFSGFTKFYSGNDYFYATDSHGISIYSSIDEAPNLSAVERFKLQQNSSYIYTEKDRLTIWQYYEPLNIYIGIGRKLENPMFLSHTIVLIFAISAILLFSILIFFYYYLRGIFKKINDKIYQVNEVIHNNFNSRIKVESDDEIGDISKSFNVLLDKINVLIKDIVKKETAQKDARLKALQYQISPHFIYNTIEIFSTKMELIGEYETGDAMVSFGKMLRYNLKSETSFSSIHGELNHVISYLNIEKLKFADQLTLTIQCDQTLYDFKMIKFILQPIVENCLIHGFNDTITHLDITIRILQVDHQIAFSVIDNGVGIDSDYCQVLNNVFKHSSYNHQKLRTNNEGGIGLKNINERLKLFYNEHCYIHINSQEQKTIVSFNLPLS